MKNSTLSTLLTEYLDRRVQSPVMKSIPNPVEYLVPSNFLAIYSLWDDQEIEASWAHIAKVYQPPEPVVTPKAIAPKYPSPRPMMIDAIAAHLNKPENVARREEARLDNANQWAKLRNS